MQKGFDFAQVLHSLPDTNPWKSVLLPFTQTKQFQKLIQFLEDDSKRVASIYPPVSHVFEAFKRTAPNSVRVVILGQDPYHGHGQAHGLSFSVPKGVKPPPSLRNIFKELERDLNIPIPTSGDLSPWADQGVFLLNATLTVEDGNAGAHQKQGWEEFTDAVISYLATTQEHIIFMLWGAYAQKKTAMINPARHLILQSVHPSPLSAHRGFLGCGHFSKANDYLQAHGMPEINWKIED